MRATACAAWVASLALAGLLFAAWLTPAGVAQWLPALLWGLAGAGCLG